VADIRLLNAGGEPKDQYPYKYDKSEQITRNASLGLHSGINFRVEDRYLELGWVFYLHSHVAHLP
jgi:hypothetical protein